MFNKSDTHTASKWACYISPLEYVLNSGMLKTFIIIYRIISGTQLDLAEGPTGHKFHILSGQMNRNINEKCLSLSSCISCIMFLENTIYLCYDLCEYYPTTGHGRIQLYLSFNTNIYKFIFKSHSYTPIGTLPRPFAVQKTSTQYFTTIFVVLHF